MTSYLAALIVLLLLLATAALGGPLFLFATLLLALAALLILLRQFGLLGYQPAIGAATVITLYLVISGQELNEGLLAVAPLQTGIVIAAIVIITLVLRLSEHDTRRAVLNWGLMMGAAVYLGLMLSYPLRLYNLHPDLAYTGEQGNPTLMTTAYAQLGGANLPTLPTVGWPLNPPPAPAISPSAQWLMLTLLVTTFVYFALLKPLARRWFFAPLLGSVLIFALSWLIGGAVAVIVGFALLALNLATITLPVVATPDKLRGGWLLALAHHLAFVAPIVYYTLVWWA